MADGARVLICALDDAAALEPAAPAGAVAAGDVIARVTGTAEGAEVALGVALADPEQFLDAFPVSNHPTVKRGDIVLSAIELAR